MAETDPFKPGVYYTGTFVTDEFTQEFGPLDTDRRLAILAEISPKPQVSQLVMQHDLSRLEQINNLDEIFHFYHVNAGGSIVGGTTATQFSDKTDYYVNTFGPPTYLIFLDENLDFRYVTSIDGGDGTASLSSSGTQPPITTNVSQYFGEYLEMISENGQDIYRITINSSDVISCTLHRSEPERTAIIRISHGHHFPFDGTNFWIEGMVNFGDLESSITEQETGYGGVSTARIGDITLQLVDKEFDYLVSQSWDSRDIEVKIGLSDLDISLYRVILRGSTESIDTNLNEIRIVIKDKSILFDRPVQNSQYGGTGGLDGDENLNGTYKPLLFGRCGHCSPILVNEAKYIYQIHDGPIHDIDLVLTGGRVMSNRGDVSDIEAWIPTQEDVDAGGYVTNFIGGYLRLAAPPAAPITAHCFGDTSVPLTCRVSDVVKSIVTRVIPESEIDQDSLNRVFSYQPGLTGVYITSDQSIRDVVNSIIAPLGVFLYLDPLNIVHMDEVRTKEPTATLSTETNILDDIVPVRAKPKRGGRLYRIGYSKAWTIFNESDFLGEVSPGVKIELQNEYRYITYGLYGDTDTRMPVYDSAKDITYYTMLNGSLFAQALAIRHAYRDYAFQDTYKLSVTGLSYLINIGDTVLLMIDDFGNKNIRTAVVVRVNNRKPTSKMENVTDLVLIA